MQPELRNHRDIPAAVRQPLQRVGAALGVTSLGVTSLGAAAMVAAMLFASPVLASGLSTARPDGPAPSVDPLAGSEWQPAEIGGEPVAPPPEVFLQFRGEGRVAGLGGCNRFTGSYRIDGTAIAFGPLAATRMACAPPAMTREQAFLSGLETARRFGRDGTRLVLWDASGNDIMRLQQRDAD